MSGQFNFILILYRPANFVGFTQLLENPCRNSGNRLRSTHYLVLTFDAGVLGGDELFLLELHQHRRKYLHQHPSCS